MACDRLSYRQDDVFSTRYSGDVKVAMGECSCDQEISSLCHENMSSQTGHHVHSRNEPACMEQYMS